MPVFRKNKFCMQLMHFECDDAENAATRRYIKTNEFYLYKSDKGICHCGIRGGKDTIINNHLQLHLGKGTRYCSQSSGTEV